MDAIMYMSEDTGAPVLNGEYGSLINVLDGVLVNGYGSMPSLGWTKEFEDVANHIAVYKMPSGSKTMIRIDDNYTPYLGRLAKFTAYESMSDVNIGIHPCPDPIETYSNITKSYEYNSTTRGWRIIGDDKGFYFLVRPYGSLDFNNDINWGLKYFFHYFGDYISIRPDDANNFCCICENSYTSPRFQSTSIGYYSSGFWRMRDSDGEVGYSTIGLGAGFYANSTMFGNNIDLSPLGGKNIYCRSYIHKDYEMLGSLPGLINWIGEYKSGNDDEIREYFEYEGSEKISFSITGYNTNFAVNVIPASCKRFTIKLGSRFRDA